MSKDYQYIGCYSDIRGKPALPEDEFNSKQVTVEQCLEEGVKQDIINTSINSSTSI